MKIQSINVNLKPCPISASHTHAEGSTCSGAPILIPCPIPRSVTLTVRLGECDGGCNRDDSSLPEPCGPWGEAPHRPNCPARPIRVTCSIGGKTWPDTFVEDVECRDAGGAIFPDDSATHVLALEAVVNLWALVKGLLLNLFPSTTQGDLVTQRDTVFAALADMARAEEAALKAQERVEAAFPYHRFHRVGGGDHRGPRPSQARLEAFVEYLAEQVGVMP